MSCSSSRNTASVVKQSRERGRAAQAAFRKRQIDKIQTQEGELRQAFDASEITQGLYLKLKNATELAADLGQDQLPVCLISDALGQLENALKLLPQKRNANSNDSHDKASNSTTPTLHTGITSHTQHISFTGTEMAPVWDSSSSTQSFMQIQNEQLNLGIARPSRKYWLGRPNTWNSIPSNLKPPPIDVVPYQPFSQHTQQTFAGKLYWMTMSMAYSLVRSPDISSNPSAQRMLGYHLRYLNRNVIKRKLETRLSVIDSQIVGCDDIAVSAAEEVAKPVHELIIQSMTQDGVEVGHFLDAREVELHLRRKSMDLNILTSGKPESADGAAADQICAILVAKIAPRAICFGDGPKWYVHEVDQVVEDAAVDLLWSNYLRDSLE